MIFAAFVVENRKLMFCLSDVMISPAGEEEAAGAELEDG